MRNHSLMEVEKKVEDDGEALADEEGAVMQTHGQEFSCFLTQYRDSFFTLLNLLIWKEHNAFHFIFSFAN